MFNRPLTAIGEQKHYAEGKFNGFLVVFNGENGNYMSKIYSNYMFIGVISGA